MVVSETYARTFSKAMSWRIWATTTTIVVGYLLTGSWALGLSIGLPDFVFKYIAYLLHDRMWLLPSAQLLENKVIYKLISWKITAMTLTICVTALMQGGDFTLALKLGPMDSAIKTLTYYVHERMIWENISWGRTEGVKKKAT
eukprot:m.35671 g.35671  ORF g.35671 m.35671 type:complete len:143 (-) comp17182_c0_seq1:524-952(-)